MDAKKTLLLEENIEMFSRQGVLSEKESLSRYEILVENYNKSIKIEALTAIEMVRRDILPAVMRYIGVLSADYNQMKSTGVHQALDMQKELLEEISTLAASAYNYVKKLEKVVAETAEIKDVTMQGTSYRDQVIPVMEELRRNIDRLETIVDSKYWPMPTYGIYFWNSVTVCPRLFVFLCPRGQIQVCDCHRYS